MEKAVNTERGFGAPARAGRQQVFHFFPCRMEQLSEIQAF